MLHGVNDLVRRRRIQKSQQHDPIEQGVVAGGSSDVGGSGSRHPCSGWRGVNPSRRGRTAVERGGDKNPCQRSLHTEREKRVSLFFYGRLNSPRVKFCFHRELIPPFPSMMGRIKIREREFIYFWFLISHMQTNKRIHSYSFSFSLLSTPSTKQGLREVGWFRY